MSELTTITLNCTKEDKRRWMEAHKKAGMKFNDWAVAKLNAEPPPPPRQSIAWRPEPPDAEGYWYHKGIYGSQKILKVRRYVVLGEKPPELIYYLAVHDGREIPFDHYPGSWAPVPTPGDLNKLFSDEL
jgi:hypothetical protein